MMVAPQSWTEARVPVIAGLADTHLGTGQPYAVRRLGELFTASLCKLPKERAPAFLPSLYSGHDARAHAVQRDKGRFVALVGDVDRGDIALGPLRAAIEAFVGASAWMIYSTASATPHDRRWRVVLPLEQPVSFNLWFDAQSAFVAFMRTKGVDLDTSATRPGQVSFLPNVPAAMRDGGGNPIFFEHASSDAKCPGLCLDRGPVADGIEHVERQRREDDQKRRKVRDQLDRRRPSRRADDGGQVIDAFNAANSLETLLESYGYERSPRQSEDWRSPQQMSKSYATRIVSGGKWVSLSGSDAASGLGEQHAAGCFGDAFDLFVHFEHGGNMRAAWKAACDEQGRNRRATNWTNADAGQRTEASNDDAAKAVHEGIRATSFVWRDPEKIPPRKWLYGKHLIRKFVSLDIAPGGLGKSSVKIVEALAMTSGQPLLGKEIHSGPLRVWLYNLEDPAEEIERRIHAAALHYGITPEDTVDRLFVDSGRDQPICVAEETPNGAMIVRPVVEEVIAELRRRRIDVLSVDPFVSSHAVNENDNRAIDMVAKEWSRIADACDCAINLVHHVRKMNGAEVTAESSRGAVSLIGAARSVVVFNRMSKEEAKSAGIPPAERGFYFRTENDKANLAPPESADWFRMNNVDLPNGDSVGVACPWQWPDAFDGISTADLYKAQLAIDAGDFGESIQASDWAGYAVADALGLDRENDKYRIKAMLKTWTENSALRVEKRPVPKGRERPFLVVGDWVNPDTLPTSKSGVG